MGNCIQLSKRFLFLEWLQKALYICLHYNAIKPWVILKVTWIKLKGLSFRVNISSWSHADINFYMYRDIQNFDKYWITSASIYWSKSVSYLEAVEIHLCTDYRFLDCIMIEPVKMWIETLQDLDAGGSGYWYRHPSRNFQKASLNLAVHR